MWSVLSKSIKRYHGKDKADCKVFDLRDGASSSPHQEGKSKKSGRGSRTIKIIVP